MRALGLEAPNAVAALLFGIAIVGAAFLLSWAAEVAQLDISAGLAIAVLAFIAVLPEYAVDMVFAWKAGTRSSSTAPRASRRGGGRERLLVALANMTGANRLLIGIGWSMVVFVVWYRTASAARAPSGRSCSSARTRSKCRSSRSRRSTRSRCR